MKDAYKPLWLILFVLAGLAALVGVSRMRAGADNGPEKVAWTTDLDAARERSAKEHKPVLVYFTATWCPPCQEMKKTTWADEKVASAIAAKYIPVKIDLDDQPAVARQFGVQMIPRVEVLGPGDARALVIDGGATSEQFLTALAGAGGA